ncbi:MAG: enoyl-CoA hydratase/isomerase family protein [Rhodospirillaceae bacterium]|jgi:enoyl-CoA hydratase|nr:enoyl-CoA hydratase/isomerase family protein [Rhodospirillaceae bacterium]MBT4590232.1 enoyl-CoA hydratase/isomerase family protein [Rhodospirillaceae bacterium]MBT5939706.1 enoyl-CoA hydratase/isomerase family protein [Rhodospirillaceae bacterium]MBT7268736.1 enoyl-CoA hydratase/isomerase family protein [Rhodospirillaceae bacterium]
MSDLLLMDRENDITTITINSPDNGNRVSDEMAVQLTDMFNEAGQNSHFIIFKSVGDDFCQGRAMIGEKPGALPEALEMRGKFDVVFDLYDAYRNSEVPILGVVQGEAHGFGAALAALTDITICSDRAKFSLPETSHNIMPTMAMSALMGRVGRKALMYMTYTCDVIDADTALTYGLASQVVPHDELDATVEAAIGKLARIPRPAIKAVKEFSTEAEELSTKSARAYARNLHATINSSERMRD